MTILSIPTKCPVCGGPVEIKRKDSSDSLYCLNPTCCAKIEGKILHFVGPHGLDIESISTATVRDLIDFGWIKDMKDVFFLKDHRNEWVNKKGYGAGSVDKIIEAIPKSIELWKIIASIGLSGIEKQTSILLADTFKTWEAFRQAINDKYDFTKLAGIGSVTAQTLLDADYSEMDEVMNYLSVKQVVTDGKLSNMSFCITGTLSMKRDDMIKIIEANGGKIASVGKNLTYLICNDKTSTSGKSKKAKDLGIPIITEEELQAMI